jgi:hypothetical protein
MGMERTDYIVYGYKFDNIDNVRDINNVQFDMWDEKYLPMVEGHLDEPYSLITGEGDVHLVFGKILEMSGDREGWDYVDLSKVGEKMTIDVMYKYKEIFFVPEGQEVPMPKLFIFSTWS